MAKSAPATATPPTVWRAGRDGIGHAIIPGRRFAFECGAGYVLERSAWPVATRCKLCTAKLGGGLGL